MMCTDLHFAIIQLDNQHQPQAERLAQVGEAIASAVASGAQWVVLPPHFNGMYAYDDGFHLQTDSADGATLGFLREQAQAHQIYIAGSFLLADTGDVTHSAFLVAPDGRAWRYDQQHPLLWERAYYRDGARPLIAHTPIGRVGMLIGWDITHDDIWARYAGRVDLILCFCALPDFEAMRLIAQDGTTLGIQQLDYLVRYTARAIMRAFERLPGIAPHLNVPIVCVGRQGELHTLLPAPRFSAQLLLMRRSHDLPIFGEDFHLHAPLLPTTGIFLPDGTHHTPPEASQYLHQTLRLPAIRPLPQGDVPNLVPIPLRDWILPAFHAGLSLNYRRITRRQWGARMAQEDTRTRWWLRLALTMTAISFVVGFLLGRQRR